MRTLYLTAIGTALAAVAAPALASDAGVAALPMMGKAATAAGAMPVTVPGGAATVHRWGSRIQGRWYGGMRAPGGWGAYRRPVIGWTLPGYWINPGFYIGNYSVYNLPAPRAGYGWSRYYDDAVLTDSNGRVYDSRSDIAWDRYEGGYGEDWNDAVPPAPAPEKRDTGIGGAVIGGVVGGVAGHVIAGKGNRTAGTLVGAGVGAIAGAVIDKAEDKGRRASPRAPARPYEAEDGPAYNGPYSGTYTGPVAPPPAPRAAPGVGYDAPPMAGRPHWAHHGAPVRGNGQVVDSYTQPGYYAGGYYYPGATVTTIMIQPTVTTTVEETSYVTQRVRKAWKPKVRCRCK